MQKMPADLPRAVSRSHGVFYLGATLMYVLSGFSLVPVVLSIADRVRASNTSLLAPWVFPLIVVCMVQVGYSLLLLQTRSRSALWTLAIAVSVMACMYAMFCGITWSASRSLAPHALDQLLTIFALWEATASGKASLWSGAMAGVYALAAYFYLQGAEGFRDR